MFYISQLIFGSQQPHQSWDYHWAYMKVLYKVIFHIPQFTDPPHTSIQTPSKHLSQLTLQILNTPHCTHLPDTSIHWHTSDHSVSTYFIVFILPTSQYTHVPQSNLPLKPRSDIDLHTPQFTHPPHPSIYSPSTRLGLLTLHMPQSTHPPHASVYSTSTHLNLLSLDTF